MTNELKVGLAVLFSLLVIYAGVRFLSGAPLFGGGYEVVAVFEDAQGLSPGAIVRLNGVRVGSVREVTLAPGARQVYVTMGIDRGVEIPRGSTLQTSGLSALGEVNVEITPPLGVAAGRPLADGDTLLAATTPDIFDLIAGESNSITARADTALQSAVRSFGSLDRILTNSGGDIEAVLAQLRFLTQATTTLIQNERDRIGRTLGSVEQAAANAEGTAARVGSNVEDLSVVVGNDIVATSRTIRGVTETNADSVAALVAGLNASARRLDASLVQLGALSTSLNGLSARLDTTLAAVNSTDGTLGLLLTDPSLYHNANAAAASLQQVLQDLQNDPSRYLRGVVRVF